MQNISIRVLAKYTIQLIIFLICFQWTEAKEKGQGIQRQEAEEEQAAILKFTADYNKR